MNTNRWTLLAQLSLGLILFIVPGIEQRGLSDDTKTTTAPVEKQLPPKIPDDKSANAETSEELLIIRHGDLPIIISAPHGGSLPVPGAMPRKGDGMEAGAAGFRTSRDGGTEELALLVVEAIDDRLDGSPSCVISRVHRKYVDFNRPPEIGVEDQASRVVYDLYHQTLRDAVTEIRKTHEFGLLIDIHGQGSSKTTVYRGTSSGLTTQGLQNRLGKQTQSGEKSLNGLLAAHGWKMHPTPFDGKEQAGFTGGHIVRSYGSHRADGIDAIQLEFGADYRNAANRQRIADELADAVIEYAGLYLKLPVASQR